MGLCADCGRPVLLTLAVRDTDGQIRHRHCGDRTDEENAA